MPETASISSRIARYLTTLAFFCCLYGIWVWLTRAGEPEQLAWLSAYGVAAASMLGSRMYLAGVDLRKWAQAVVSTGRSARSITVATLVSDARRAGPPVVALLIVTATVGGITVIGTQPMSVGQSGEAQAISSEAKDTREEIHNVAEEVGANNKQFLEDLDTDLSNNEQEFSAGEDTAIEILLNNGTAAEAQTAANKTIEDQYAIKQKNLVDRWNVTIETVETLQTQAEETTNVSSEIIRFAGNDESIHPEATFNSGSKENIEEYGYAWASTFGETNITIVDGSTVRAKTVGGSGYNHDEYYDRTYNYNIAPEWFENGEIREENVQFRSSDYTDYRTDVMMYRIAVNQTADQSATEIIDLRDFWSNSSDIEANSQSTKEEMAVYINDTLVPAAENGTLKEFIAPDLTGTVVNQANQPVQNATVQLTISKEPSIPQADTQLDQLSNPIPNAYEQQIQNGFDLLGTNGVLTERDGQYAAVYSTTDLGLTYQGQADLTEPKITSVEPGEQQAIILADTTADCGLLGLNTNEYNQQIPGCVQPEGNVTIEKLSGTGDIVATDTVSVEEAGNYRDFGGTTNIHYAPYTFTEGIYRISPADDDGISYLIKAGTPRPDFNRYSRTVENQFTTQAENLRDAIDQDLLEVKTVTTNETGHWNASVPDNTKLVTVTARKAPGVDVEPANLTYENMSDAYNAENSPNASVYLPSRTKRVSLPASNVDVTLREVAFPSFANMDKLQTRLEDLRNKLNNLTMDDLPQQLLQRMETESREDLATAWASLRETLVNYEPAREAYLEVSGRESVPTADELSKRELQTAIQNANVALTRSSSTGQLTETASETTEDAISQTWELSGLPLNQANVSVIADYSNGTSRVVSDEYIQTDSAVVGADTISVEDYPLGEGDPEQVSFRLRVAGADELAETTSSVLNPTFADEPPSIDAVEITSLRPGPDDRVTVEIHPDDESTFESVANVSVRGPEGSTIETSNITDGTTTTFTTNGAGTHSIRFTVESESGGTFTDVVQVEAAETDETMRPSIYAHSGPLGTYALVGDGFEAGDVETTSTGSLEIIGVLGADQDVPNTVDVFTEGVDVGTESTTTIRIVRGESRQGVRANVPVVIHTPMLNSPDDDRSHKTLVRANGNPITFDGATRYGVVEMDDDGASIKAYTADDGILTLSLDNTPTWFERTNFSLDTDYPWLPLMGAVGSSPLLAGLLVFTRRRSGH